MYVCRVCSLALCTVRICHGSEWWILISRNIALEWVDAVDRYRRCTSSLEEWFL